MKDVCRYYISFIATIWKSLVMYKEISDWISVFNYLNYHIYTVHVIIMQFR